MSAPRDRKWLSVRGIAGGLALFAAEALIVVALVALAWLFSTFFLAIL